MKTIISEYLKWFLVINTAILVVVGISVFKYDYVSPMIIPQVFCASFLTSLETYAFFSYNPQKPIKMWMRILLYCGHYLVLCATIMLLGTSFGWFERSLKGGITVAISVAGVYFLSAVITYVLSKGEADEMTDALKKYRDE